jgi:hypothetical protein
MTIKEFLVDFYSLSLNIERERCKPLHAFMLAMVLANTWCLVFFVYFMIIGSWIAYLTLVYAAIGVALIHMLKTRGNEKVWTVAFSLQLVTMLNLCIYYFGWESGFHYPLLTTFLFTFLPRYKIYWFPILMSLFNFASILVGFYIFQDANPDRIEYSETLVNALH